MAEAEQVNPIMDKPVLSEESKTTRSKQMQILVLGLCRTGTYSLKAALEELGYSVYHMSTVWHTPGHADLWSEALEMKFGREGSRCEGAGIGVGFFERILGGFDVVTDIPAACFGPELVRAYPDAKIILTTRSTESWVKSMNETIWASQSDPLRPLDKLRYNAHFTSIAKMMDLIFSTYFYSSFPLYGARVFNEHNDRIRTLALSLPNPQEKFLEFQPGKQGWKELCQFLGKEIPDKEGVKGEDREFSRINDSKSWRSMFRPGERWVRVKWWTGGVGVVGGLAVVGFVAWRRMRR